MSFSLSITLVLLSMLSIAVYVRYTFLFRKGLSILKYGTLRAKPKVSVVVAARNESRNIQMLLTSLVNQSFPQDRYQIVVADDQSTDDTAEKISIFAEKWSNVVYLSVANRDKARSPKKNALTQAIQASDGEIILTTDADCVVPQFWIESMVACFEDGIDMVAGYSRPKILDWKKANFIQKYEYFDVFAIFAAAAGALGIGKPFSCSGQNLAYRKSAFDEVGGFSSIANLISGDDVNLMQLMRNAGKKTAFAINAHSFVYTKPIDSIESFFNQRSRWASNLKAQIDLNQEFFNYLLAVAAMHVFSIAMFFIEWHVAAIIWTARFIFELKFLLEAKQRFLFEPERFGFFFLWFLLQPLYIAVTALRGVLDIYKWHGRR